MTDFVSVPFRGFLFLTLSPEMLAITVLKVLFAAGRIFSGQRKQPLPEKIPLKPLFTRNGGDLQIPDNLPLPFPVQF